MKNEEQELLDNVKVVVVNAIKSINGADDESKNRTLKVILGILWLLCLIPLGTLEGGGGIFTFPIFYLTWIIVALIPIQFVWKISNRWNIVLSYLARGITVLLFITYASFFLFHKLFNLIFMSIFKIISLFI